MNGSDVHKCLDEVLDTIHRAMTNRRNERGETLISIGNLVAAKP
jgi:hypothetical protein